MRRRDFVGLVGRIAMAWPLGAQAQSTKHLPRVGVLWHAASADEEEVYLSVWNRPLKIWATPKVGQSYLSIVSQRSGLSSFDQWHGNSLI
jgi:hypothetical protein